MKTLISLIIIGLLFFSCNKGKADFTIKGTITDATFNSGINNSIIHLYEIEAGGGATNLLGSMNLTDGTYSFTFPRNKAEAYTLVVEKTNYFTLNENIWFSDLTIEEDNIANYNMTAKSWVNLKFSNPDPNDQLKYVKIDGKAGCDECCSTEEQFLNGVIDTTITCINDGNTPYSYNYWLLGTTISGNKQVTTVPFDTVDLVLNY